MAFVPKITINETDEGFVHPYSQTPFATREAMWADLQQHFSPKHDWQRQDIDYVEDATEGQWGKNDQKWGLIRMGMDARDQERSKQEQELGRSKGSRGHFDAGHT